MRSKYKTQILELRSEGKTYPEINDILGCSKSVISYHCRKAGLEDPNRNRIPSEEEIAEMQKLYDEIGSYKKVAKRLKWSSFTVHKYVKLKQREKLSPEELKKNRSQSVVNWRKRTKQKLVDYKGGKCQICPYDRCIDALEFHHLDPNEKDFTISGKSWKYERLVEEVDKCIMVCSCCHKEIHAGYIDLADYGY